MTNAVLLNDIINKYNQLSATHNYIFGFIYKKNVYAVEATSEILPFILTLTEASRNQGYALRFAPTNEQKVFLLSLNSAIICSKDFFNMEVENSIYNRGETFEKMITERCGQEWKKDNIPFYKDGDIKVDGKSYQIKFEKATFTNEAQLARL